MSKGRPGAIIIYNHGYLFTLEYLHICKNLKVLSVKKFAPKISWLDLILKLVGSMRHKFQQYYW